MLPYSGMVLMAVRPREVKRPTAPGAEGQDMYEAKKNYDESGCEKYWKT